MPKRLFVYGTLMPGHAPACVGELVGRFRTLGRATVGGRLYSLDSYPGLVLDLVARSRGVVCELPDDPYLLRRLDAYEGFNPAAPSSSLFRRVSAVATLADGTTVDCETYIYNRSVPPNCEIAGGDWLNRIAPAPTYLPTHSPMKRPVIGITSGSSDTNPSRYEIPADYAASVERAGGLPMIIPFRAELSLIPDLLDLLDGIVFIGGNDLDPALYGETWHPRAERIDPQRQTFDLALIAEVERRKLPTLGICLGSQLINVHRGGSLHQFLPDVPRDAAVEHRNRGDDTFRHAVKVTPGTVLADVIGTDAVETNSRHKQAICKLGRGLRVNAVATDGVIEGIEDPTMPLFLAVQWHPENLTATSPRHLRLFERLVDVARKTSQQPTPQ